MSTTPLLDAALKQSGENIRFSDGYQRMAAENALREAAEWERRYGLFLKRHLV